MASACSLFKSNILCFCRMLLKNLVIDKCSFVFISESGLFDLRVMSQILAKQFSLSVKQQVQIATFNFCKYRIFRPWLHRGVFKPFIFISLCFQIDPLWTTYSTVCFFHDHLHGRRMNEEVKTFPVIAVGPI